MTDRRAGPDLRLTAIVSTDGRLHQVFHPILDDPMLVASEKVRLFPIMHQLETKPGPRIRVGQDLVPGQVDMSLDLVLLWALHVIEMRTLEDKVSVLPGVVTFTLLLHVAGEIGLADLGHGRAFVGVDGTTRGSHRSRR